MSLLEKKVLPKSNLCGRRKFKDELAERRRKKEYLRERARMEESEKKK
jgi:hypothetical protein